MSAFPTCAPESAGLSSAGILRFVEEMKEKRLHLHSLMILRHGKELCRASFAPYRAEDKHMLFSLSKSFTSTAVGFAVQDGLLSVDDRLIDFFPDLLPSAPCENMQKMRIRHLLTMNTGHTAEPDRKGESWERNFLRSYVPLEPGTRFLYNTSATYMLAAVVQKVTGRKLLDYLREKLMDPLGMSPDIWFEESSTGVATGGYGLNVRVEDIARLGQFYLQRGKWEGRQLLPEAWILDAQKPWSDNSFTRQGISDWGMGYGYQFWMCIPEHVYRGDGAFGQYCIICPDQDMVIAITSGVEDMGAVMQGLWNHVLPTVDQPDRDSGAADRLAEALRAPVLPAVWEETGESVRPPVIDPAWYGRYKLQCNDMGLEAVEITSDGLSLTRFGTRTDLPFSLDTWQAVELGAEGGNPRDYFRHAALRAARTAEGLILHLCFTDTPFENVLRLRFQPHGLTLALKQNVGMGDTAVQLIGMRI